MPVEIPLTRGFVAVVDDEDAALLAGRKWQAEPGGDLWYAGANFRLPDGRWRRRLMHRVIADAPKGVEVDHRDGDGLNNRKENLRLATRPQNTANVRVHADNQCGFKGVCWMPRAGRWKAEIQREKERFSLGTYGTAMEASLAYDCASRHLFGEFCRPNHPDVTSYPFTPESLIAIEQTSRFRGVTLEIRKHRNPRWLAYIRQDGRMVKLGRFRDEVDAAKAYDERARALHGNKARPNFP